MGLFGQIFGTKPSTPIRRPSVQRPIPKQKSKPEPKPGIFGQKKYRPFLELREFARKAPYEKIPTYGKKLSRKERVDLIKNLQKYTGSSSGVTEQKFNVVLKKMTKEKIQAGYKRDYKKVKELDQQIKQLGKWRKG